VSILKRQRGATTVEFAVVGLVLLIILFAAFEFARAFYVFNALNEATRRGARVAAVCPVNDPAIREIAIFNTPGGGATSSMIANLTTANVNLSYLDRLGNTVVDPVADFGDIWFVRVAIVNFTVDLRIPLLSAVLTAPEFQTTVPRESLGVSREGITPC
jgi:Flp pilus assembly protein TadG